MKVLRQNEKGFTLVELLIVVIILSVLAAVIIPQLRGSTENARLSSLDTNLASTRSALEIYYIQHNNNYPGNVANDTVGATTTAHANANAAFVAQMSKYSDEAGNTSDKYDAATFKLGPYMKKGLPANPLPNAATTTDAQKKTVNVDITTLTLDTAAASDTAAYGWIFVKTTGEFFSNNTTNESR